MRNNRAWAQLFLDPIPSGVLEEALGATSGALTRTHADLHTLATVYAELGDAPNAIKVLREAVSTTTEDQPDAVDWYVIGRLAEHYKLPDDARAAYERVLPSRDRGATTHVLAQRRLKSLAAPEKTP
jgi:hypothetical protein